MTNKDRYGPRIKALAAEGKNYTEIIQILGCAKSTVAYHLGDGQKEKTAGRAAKCRQRMNEYKETHPCADCGNNYPYYVMDFDHLPGHIKSNMIAHMKTNSWEVILAEIAKCELVCSNCHRIRTHTRKQYNAPIV